MFRTATLRRSHRWLGLFVGVQLLAWALSGAYFAWTRIESVRGDDRRSEPSPLLLEPGWRSPSELLVADSTLAGEVPTAEGSPRLRSLAVVRLEGRSFYRLETGAGRVTLYDVFDLRPHPPVDASTAKKIAARSLAVDAPITGVRPIRREDVGPHHEYRGGPLPAWRVDFDDGRATRVYVAAADGAVVRHRNRSWRIFDFLWMLHTMDYRGRDDIDNPLLRTAAIFAVLTLLAGYLLAWRTSAWRRWRQRR